MKKIFFILITLLVFISCTSTDIMNVEERNKNLENKKFYIMNESLKKYNVSVEFKDGSIYGFSGVNKFFGSYKLEKNYLIVAGLGSTLKAGNVEDMNFEFYFLKLLQSSPSYRYRNGVLEIEDSKGNVIKLEEVMEKNKSF